MDCSDAGFIYVDFWYYDDDLEPGEYELEYFDGTSWDLIADLGINTEDTWHNYQEKISDAQYFIADFQVQWVVTGAQNGEHAYFDQVTITKETSGSNYYDLDLEVAWSGLPTKTNEWLSIYGGTLGAETIQVNYWDGGAWVNVLPSVSSGWNNLDVSGILGSSSFIIRFVDTTGVGDLTQNSYEIDSVYLNLWD